MTQVPQAVFWLVSAVLVVAAVIDGRQLRVPNWLTFHFALGGLVFAAWSGGREMFLWSLAWSVASWRRATARLARASDNVSGHDLGLE